jgi:hypothetical protein
LQYENPYEWEYLNLLKKHEYKWDWSITPRGEELIRRVLTEHGYLEFLKGPKTIHEIYKSNLEQYIPKAEWPNILVQLPTDIAQSWARRLRTM